MNQDVRKIGVFVSRPTWIGDQYKAGLENFLSSINEFGYDPRTLGTTEYAIGNPLDKVIEMMKICKGLIVLGYPQIFIKSGHFKDGICQENMSFCTEWNHVEAAIGLTLKLPVFIIFQKGLEKRGIFAPNAFPGTPYEVDLSSPQWSSSDHIKGALREWMQLIKYNEKVPNDFPKSIKSIPTCPNCSTEIKPKYMNPVTKSQALLYSGVTHDCKCGFMM